MHCTRVNRIDRAAFAAYFLAEHENANRIVASCVRSCQTTRRILSAGFTDKTPLVRSSFVKSPCGGNPLPVTPAHLEKLDLEQILSNNHGASEMPPRGIEPHRI